MLNACYHEDVLIPTTSESSERFTFPQGTNDYDLRAKKIFDEFGVKIIYKGFNDRDFNLTWTTPAIGKVGYDIPKDQERDAVDFMATHFFGNLTPQITRKVLPPYYYIADSVHQITIQGDIQMCSTTAFIYNGLDFWFFGWNNASAWTMRDGEYLIKPSVPSIRPKTPFGIFYKRGTILKEVFKKAVEVGNIIPPEGFADGFDFVTKVETAAGLRDNPNYYMKRGFPGQMTNQLRFDMAALALVTQTNSTTIFTNYIHLCMRYTTDSIEVVYPKADFPMIHQKYPIVLDYMKNKYNIDLGKIATKPETTYQ